MTEARLVVEGEERLPGELQLACIGSHGMYLRAGRQRGRAGFKQPYWGMDWLTKPGIGLMEAWPDGDAPGQQG